MKRHRLPVFVACLALAGCAAVATDNAALPGYHWQLSDAIDGGQHRLDALLDTPDQPLQLDFSANALSVRNACNAIHGRYSIVKNHLVVQLMAQTMMACMHPSLMQREIVIKQVLRSGPVVTLSRNAGHVRLTLASTSGQLLTFTGVPVTDNP